MDLTLLRRPKQKIYQAGRLLCLSFLSIVVQAQSPSKSLDLMLARLSAITSRLPANIHEAYIQYGSSSPALFDSIADLFSKGAKELADMAGQRSGKLNAYAGYNNPEALPFVRLPVHPKLDDFFLAQGYKIEALDRAMNQFLKRPDKAAYVRQGYVSAWDSAYQKRVQSLRIYSAGLLKQVKAELAFLATHEQLLKSSKEEVRVDYLERYLTVLGRLVNWNNTLRKVVGADGAEIVGFCKQYPATCDRYARP